MFGFAFETVFVGMIAIAVLLLFQAFVVPAFGENSKTRKKMKSRLLAVAQQEGEPRKNSLVREKYLRQLPGWVQWLESLPGMAALGRIIEQAGQETPSHHVLLRGAVFGVVTGLIIFVLTAKAGMAVILGALASAVPFLMLLRQRTARLNLFEEQLPDALSTMSRALKAGYPFSETLKLVADELDDPVAHEFEITFNDANFGGDLQVALAGLLTRIPSVTVMALVSAVSIQKETGGNLAELFDKLEHVIRGRYKFMRTLRTLSAEGRLAAWIMSLFPFVLGAILSVVNPMLLPMLLYDPTGQKLILAAFVGIVIGILWMQRIVRVDV